MGNTVARCADKGEDASFGRVDNIAATTQTSLGEPPKPSDSGKIGTTDSTTVHTDPLAVSGAETNPGPQHVVQTGGGGRMPENVTTERIGTTDSSTSNGNSVGGTVIYPAPSDPAISFVVQCARSASLKEYIFLVASLIFCTLAFFLHAAAVAIQKMRSDDIENAPDSEAGELLSFFLPLGIAGMFALYLYSHAPYRTWYLAADGEAIGGTWWESVYSIPRVLSMALLSIGVAPMMLSLSKMAITLIFLPRNRLCPSNAGQQAGPQMTSHEPNAHMTEMARDIAVMKGKLAALENQPSSLQRGSPASNDANDKKRVRDIRYMLIMALILVPITAGLFLASTKISLMTLIALTSYAIVIWILLHVFALSSDSKLSSRNLMTVISHTFKFVKFGKKVGRED